MRLDGLVNFGELHLPNNLSKNNFGELRFLICYGIIFFFLLDSCRSGYGIGSN